MAYYPATPFVPQFTNDAGVPLSGGTIMAYIAGTTTPTNMFVDDAGTSAGSVITLNARGEPQVSGNTVVIWLNDAVSYKFILRDASANSKWTIDNISAGSSTLRNDLADDSDTAKGDALIAVVQPYEGARAQTQHDVNAKTIWLDDFDGYDGTGSSVSDTAFISAIAALSHGGEVLIPSGASLTLSTPLVSNKAVLFRAAVRGDISSNTNGGGYGSSKPIIRWTGSAGAYMYTIRPQNTGDVIWGGGSQGVEWDGNALAATAVHLDNTKFAKFDGKVRSVTYAGVVVDSQSGSVGNFSQQNIIDLEFIWGVAAACQGAHGLVLGGNGATVPATQQQLGSVTGLIYNGYLIRIAETDNCFGRFVNAAVQAPGTGGALLQVNAGAQPANHNNFFHLVGPVVNDANIIGPFIAHYNSEGGGISQSAGTSVWSGELVDYVTGRTYSSHKYKLREKISIPPAAFAGDTNSGADKLASVWQTLTWPETGGDVDISAVLPDLYAFDNGTISAVEILYAPIGASAGNLRFQTYLSTVADSASAPLITPDGDVSTTVAAGAQYTLGRAVLTFGSPVAITKGDTIFISLRRKSGDAADTHTGSVAFLGARILYTSTGPNSAGSGAYSVPEW